MKQLSREKLVSLSAWRKYYPDGVGLSHYVRIRKLILSLGTEVKVNLSEGDYDQLESELKRLEKGGAK